MTITSSGPKCDVCGNHILPFDPEERVNFFTVSAIPGKELHADNKCKTLLEEMPQGQDGNWKVLPEGPLRKAFEEADAKRLANTEAP